MVTPYDWQEGMTHRAEFVESRLKAGVPVMAVSIPDGILVATYKKQAHKVYEIYDRLVYSAVGIQSDVEAARVAAIEFSHQEGYRRSVDDVTVARVANHISQPIKQSFGDFSRSPLVLRCFFGEVGATIEDDRYYLINYDGDYTVRKRAAFIAGTHDSFLAMLKAVNGVDFEKINLVDARAQLREAVLKGMDPDGSKAASSSLPELNFECAILERNTERSSRFKRLNGDEDI